MNILLIAVLIISAILIIVNSLTSYDIAKVLKNYANYIEFFNKETRFDIRTATDYERLYPILKQLISEGYIFR